MKKVELITSIPEVGLLTALTVLSETNGFELIRNKTPNQTYGTTDWVLLMNKSACYYSFFRLMQRPLLIVKQPSFLSLLLFF